MKKNLLILSTLLALRSTSQVIKFQSGIGYAIVSGSNFKKNSLAANVGIGCEFILKEFLYLDLMAGISTLRYSIDNTQSRSYYIRRFMAVPAMIKKYFPLSKKSSLFCEVGAGFNYDLSNHIEFFTDSSSAKFTQKKIGHTISLNGGCGFKTQITRTVGFDIHIYSQTDLLAYYKNQVDKIKTDRKLLSFNLYFKLKK